jgi:hypothetical protein
MRMTGHYVVNHAQEIGLSADAAAVGGLAADAVEVVDDLGLRPPCCDELWQVGELMRLPLRARRGACKDPSP